MKTILLVDDDSDVRGLLRSSFGPHPIRVLEAASAEQARAAIAAHDVDLAVVDGALPDGSGVDLIAELRRGGWAGPVVFLTGLYRDLVTFRRLTEELAVDLVAYKPVDPPAFCRSVARLIGAERQIESESGPIRTPVPQASSGAREALAKLREAFAARLPGKLAELREAVTGAQQSGDADAVEHARSLAHRLRGSAGSYGFGAVGKAIGNVEDQLIAEARAPDGSRFVPVAEALNAADQAYWAQQEPAAKAETPAGDALLIVDDDPAFLKLVAGVSQELALPVVTARDAAECIRQAERQRLVAAIVDVQLHGQADDAFSLARRIRETPLNGEIPIAFISEDGRIATRVAAIEAGGQKFFEKPISSERLGHVIHAFLQSAQARRGRVLIVDDDPDTREHYAAQLRGRGYAVSALGSATNLVESIEAQPPDVLILDVDLPSMSGIDVCRALRASERWELLPVLVVTGHADMQTRLAAFAAGASDVLLKPVLEEELMARVGVQVDRQRLIRDRADKDALSGLLLRRAFAEAFQRAHARCRRQQAPMSVALLDIDHFKAINDTHGHLVGDRVIAAIGSLLQRRYRTEDLRARWGGEEFLLAFPGQSAAVACEAVSRLKTELAGQSFRTDSDQSFHVTFSAGVASFPDDGETLTELVRIADERLYVAKRSGRDRVQGPDALSSPPKAG